MHRPLQREENICSIAHTQKSITRGKTQTDKHLEQKNKKSRGNKTTSRYHKKLQIHRIRKKNRKQVNEKR